MTGYMFKFTLITDSKNAIDANAAAVKVRKTSPKESKIAWRCK